MVDIFPAKGVAINLVLSANVWSVTTLGGDNNIALNAFTFVPGNLAESERVVLIHAQGATDITDGIHVAKNTLMPTAFTFFDVVFGKVEQAVACNKGSGFEVGDRREGIAGTAGALVFDRGDFAFFSLIEVTRSGQQTHGPARLEM